MTNALSSMMNSGNQVFGTARDANYGDQQTPTGSFVQTFRPKVEAPPLGIQHGGTELSKVLSHQQEATGLPAMHVDTEFSMEKHLRQVDSAGGQPQLPGSVNNIQTNAHHDGNGDPSDMFLFDMLYQVADEAPTPGDPFEPVPMKDESSEDERKRRQK